LKEQYNNLNRAYVLAERLRKLGVDDLNILKENKCDLNFILVSLKEKEEFKKSAQNIREIITDEKL